MINDYTDFGDMTTDDDDAISWFPTSSDVNVIRFLVPFRSITVHTNTGIYSSPLAEIAAITPSAFTLQLQDSTPADVLQPQAIDNQIIVIAGNDAHAMVWDGINNAYTTNIVSIPNEQTIRSPVDEAPFADLTEPEADMYLSSMLMAQWLCIKPYKLKVFQVSHRRLWNNPMVQRSFCK